MSEAEAAARGSGAGTSRWLFRRGSLPLLTAVAAALALGLHLAGWLQDPPPVRSPDDGAALGDTEDMAAPSKVARVGSIPAGTSRPTLHPPSPLRRAAAAPGKDVGAPAAPGRPPTSSPVARHAAALHAGDPSDPFGPEPAAGPDSMLAPAVAASPGAPGPTQAGAASPPSDAVAAPSDGAGVAAPVACPTTVEGLEDVAADLVTRRARFDEREMALLLRAAALEEAERRLAQRAAELEQLAGELQARSGEIDAAQAARIARLVKVYEAMKPKQAAEVFDRLPLDLAVGVAAAMREVKIAAVLAAMSPDRAQRLTTELARLRRPLAEADPSAAR